MFPLCTQISRRETCARNGSIPTLRPLHPLTALSSIKLTQMERLTTEAIIKSLAPGQRDCLKAKADGTMLDGHHRIHILRIRGVKVDALPREIILEEEL